MVSHGLGDTNRRQRRQRRWRLVRIFLYLIAIFALVFYAVDLGEQRAAEEVARLQQLLVAEQARAKALARDGATAEARLAAAVARGRELEARHAEEAPQGVEKDLLRLVRERLAAKVGAERLATIVALARNESRCDEAPVTRRFLVQTPLSQGPASSVSFANGLIYVAGDGTSARDEGGNPEAWYDPAQPVTLRFTAVGGEAQRIAGLLPLHHSVVVGSAELRFSVVAGARGFAQVAADSCRYP